MQAHEAARDDSAVLSPDQQGPQAGASSASSSCHRYQHALEHFVAVSAQRKRFFQALKRAEAELNVGNGGRDPAEDEEQPARNTAAQMRIFVLSESDKPWSVFTAIGSSSVSENVLSLSFTTSLRTKRLVFEWSDLHFSELHSACASGDKTLVRKLLAQESCSLARDASGRISLHHAAIREQLQIVRLLLINPDAKLQVHVRDNSGYSAAHYVLFRLKALAHRRYSQRQPAHRVALRMRRVSKRYRRLWQAADEMLRLTSPLWLSDCGDVSTNSTEDLDFSLRALDWRCRGDAWDATRSGDLERLRFLFEVYYNRAQAQYGDSLILRELGHSLLHEACDQQHLSVLYYLVTHQYQQQYCQVVNKHLKDASGCTALQYAAMRGFLEGCVVLLEDQQQVEAQGSCGDDTEALCLAVDMRGRTALHWSLLASQTQSEEAQRASVVTKYLVTMCILALHVSDEDGFTPLHVAIWRGDLEIVELFVRLGASVNTASCGSNTSVALGSEATRSIMSTAPWAPCGARFHGTHREPGKLKDQDAQPQEQGRAPADTAVQDLVLQQNVNSSLNPQEEDEESDEGNAADENSVVMDTLKFWLHTSKKKKKTHIHTVNANGDHAVLLQGARSEKSQVPSPKTQGPSANPEHGQAPKEGEEDENNNDSSARGCRKYGGICSACSNHSDAREDSSGAASYGSSGVISPLVLAIRACGRRGRDRIAVVELLLLAGADPNEVDASGGENDGGVETLKRSPLVEALYVATSACPHIIPLLLAHGAKRVCVRQLERFCLSSITSGDATAAEVDTVLLDIVDILNLHEHAIESASLLFAAFFTARCFNSLTRLLHRHHRYRGAADEDADKQVDSPPLSLWRAILAGLSGAQVKSRLAAHSQLRLDREHLWFLCESLKRNQQQSSEQECRHHADAELRELLSYCLDRCLTTWRRQVKVTPVKEDHERLERQQLVSNCMELLRSVPNPDAHRHERPEPAQEEHVRYQAQQLDHCLALGFFECALGLLDAQLAESQRSAVSMDHLLRIYGDEVLGNRHHRLLGLPSSHEDFLIALVEKCVAAMEWALAVQPDTATDTDPQGPPPVVRVSSEAFVRVCAYNLPLELVSKIWDLVRLNNGDCCVELMGGRLCRVGGKTLVEWLVHHRRRDLIHFLIENGALTRANTILLWRDCVSTVVGVAGSETNKRELLGWLLSLYPSSSEGGAFGDGNEALETIEWLALHRAVRCDSPLLFATIVEPLWSRVLSAASSGDPKDVTHASETSERDPSPPLSRERHSASDRTPATAVAPLPPNLLFSRLRRIRCFHQVAQWNALKLATFLMNERFIKPPPSDKERRVITALQWRDVLLGLRGDDEEEEQTVAESSSPLAICCALGHVQLARLFLERTGSATDSSVFPPELQDLHTHGLFNTIMSLNAQVSQASQHPYGRQGKAVQRLEVFQTVDHWQVAAKLNLVTHLHALRLHSIPVSTSASPVSLLQGVPALLLLSITSGSLAALEWLLVNHFSKNARVSNPTVVETLYEAASKHPSDLYALTTLLLLDHIPYDGRLSGDGSNVTLLHRCVCFTSPQLMRKAVDRVLSIPGGSVNVLDAFGDSPVVYACMSGNLSSLCYLVSSKNARLEAEYEGQASFYYALQLLPSFAWRFVMEKLLVTDKCGRRFLHCDGGETELNDESCISSCGCKGFESGAAGETERVQDDGEKAPLVVCSFCGHKAEHHRKIPFPPWFMDQYETYLGKAQEAIITSDKRGSESDSEGEERERKLEGSSVSEVTLENQRGRLHVAALTAITAYKYSGLLEEHELSVDVLDPVDAQESPQTSPSEAGDSHSGESSWSTMPLNILGEQAAENGDEAQTRSGPVDPGKPPEAVGVTKAYREHHVQHFAGGYKDGDLQGLPLHLREELQMVHSPVCSCHKKPLITTTFMWKYEIVSQWLWFSASCWRRHSTTTTTTTTTTQLHVLRCSCWAVRVAFARWRKDTAQQLQRHHHSLQLETRLSNNKDENSSRRLLRKLQQFLSHWQFANVFVAFQRWRHIAESAQVRHMHLQALVEDVDAQMRRTRFETLREKHKQLQKRIAQL